MWATKSSLQLVDELAHLEETFGGDDGDGCAERVAQGVERVEGEGDHNGQYGEEGVAEEESRRRRERTEDDGGGCTEVEDHPNDARDRARRCDDPELSLEGYRPDEVEGECLDIAFGGGAGVERLDLVPEVGECGGGAGAAGPFYHAGPFVVDDGASVLDGCGTELLAGRWWDEVGDTDEVGDGVGFDGDPAAQVLVGAEGGGEEEGEEYAVEPADRLDEEVAGGPLGGFDAIGPEEEIYE